MMTRPTPARLAEIRSHHAWSIGGSPGYTPEVGELLAEIDALRREVPRPICASCQQPAPYHSMFRCFDCGGWFDSECMSKHLTETQQTGSVRADRDRLAAHNAKLREVAMNAQGAYTALEFASLGPLLPGLAYCKQRLERVLAETAP